MLEKFSLKFTLALFRERSGSVVECLTRDRRAAGSSLTGVTGLWSLSKTHLVLVHPRKIRPCVTEILLMGRKESNQTKNTLALPVVLFNLLSVWLLHLCKLRYL